MSKIDDVVIDELNSNTNKEKTMPVSTISMMKLVQDLLAEGYAMSIPLGSVKANGWHRAVCAWQEATKGKDLCIVDYKRMVEVAMEITMLQAKVTNLQATVASLESTLAGNTATIITPKEYKPIEKFSVKVRFFVNPEEGVVADDTETHAYIGIGEEDEDHPQDNTIFFYTKLTAEAFMKQHTKENSTEDFYVVEDCD
jgi:hypothetical protein